MSDTPYPFESDDDIEIRELDIESLDAVAEARITVGQLAGENESWRYGHVIVDEAQDLTPMQWRMIMRRVRGRALTIVGDLAQRSASVATAWSDLLPPELASAQRQDLTVNYRSPTEIHHLAVAVLADFAPGVAPSRSIRNSGWQPEFFQVDAIADDLDGYIAAALDTVGGQVAVIGIAANDLVSVYRDKDHRTEGQGTEGHRTEGQGTEGHRTEGQGNDRVRFLTPIESKGLEFDAVLLIEPADILQQHGGASQLYIALTRAMQRLTVVHQLPLPAVLLADS